MRRKELKIKKNKKMSFNEFNKQPKSLCIIRKEGSGVFCSERSRIGYQAKTISINTFFLFFVVCAMHLMGKMEKGDGKNGNEKVLKRPTTEKQQKPRHVVITNLEVFSQRVKKQLKEKK